MRLLGGCSFDPEWKSASFSAISIHAMPPPRIKDSSRRPLHSRKAVRIAVIFLSVVALAVLVVTAVT